ncbi:phosphatase PAP2 family protein, partial [Halorubrum distributum]
LAAAVVYSTMFLGIHWATDVVVGAVLGAGSATVGARIVTRVERQSTGGGPEPLDGPSADRKPKAGDD